MVRPTIRRSFLIALVVLGNALGQAAFTSAADTYSPAAVKAAFLYRFAGYITWPSERESRTFTIAVLGDEDVYLELARFLAGRQVMGFPARVKRINSLRELGDARMLYVGSAFLGNLRATLRPIAKLPVLVVTDRADGLDAGSTVNFLLDNRRVRFEISLVAADRSGLRISAELLSVAVRVQGTHHRSDASCIPSVLPTHDRCEDRSYTES
jgi:hypothetical protein